MPDSQATAENRCDADCSGGRRFDALLWVSLALVVVFYTLHRSSETVLPEFAGVQVLAHSVYELVNRVWWGLLAGIVMIAVLGCVPREFVLSALGVAGGLRGVCRAALAGVLLDLCSHGVLMVGAKLYERGASAGQVIAFLLSSPWNSLSLTLILIALIGGWWTLVFIVASMLVAITTGLIFELLVSGGRLPENTHRVELPPGFKLWPEARKLWQRARFTPSTIGRALLQGLKESRMVLRWVFFGVLLASLIRAFVPLDVLQTWFGPTLMGLGATLVAATVIEVCSEGSTPIAADLVTRSHAPGNGFAFLMAGVATDYTEVMVLRETTNSWRIALFLPLITLPQVLLFGWLLNVAG